MQRTSYSLFSKTVDVRTGFCTPCGNLVASFAGPGFDSVVLLIVATTAFEIECCIAGESFGGQHFAWRAVLRSDSSLGLPPC